MSLLAGVFAGGLSTAAALARQAQLPARVTALETWRAGQEPQVRYLVCRAIESDAGRSPRPCQYLLRDPETYLVPPEIAARP